jgi:hypothetical protein
MEHCFFWLALAQMVSFGIGLKCCNISVEYCFYTGSTARKSFCMKYGFMVLYVIFFVGPMGWIYLWNK